MNYFQIILIIIIYIFAAYCLQKIAVKTNTPKGWLAYIPVFNLVLALEIAGMYFLWFILFLIPLINIIIAAIMFWKISKRLNKPGWIGLLMFVPIVNLIILGYWAFSE